MIQLRCLLMIALITCSGALLHGEDSKDEDFQQIVDQAVEKYAAAFIARDAQALAAMYTPEAEYVDSTGLIFHGRDLIEAEFAASFEAAPQGTVDVEVISIRPIATGVIVEEGVSTFAPADEAKAANITRYIALHVKQPNGTWLLASVRELESGKASPHDQLLQLKWLVGAWREESEGNVVSTEWKWSKNGAFLISNFKTISASGEPLEGTHRIGWDAERSQFRSWIFDSSGGSADGWWNSEDDGGWSVQLSGVDDAGTRVSSTLTFLPDGEDALLVTQDRRRVGGINIPGRSARIVRQPPAPQTP